jgi:CRP/FNR family transcriptional regulator, cyclic AMP receptor protein
VTAVEALQRSSLFKDFTETGLRIFAAIAKEKAIPAGTPLFVENTVGESLFVVKSGTVRILQNTPEGDRQLGTIGPGEHLGELAILARSVRLVSAVAATSCEVLELSQREFLRLQPEKPQACLKLALAIAATLAGRVAENRELLRQLSGRAPSGP